MCCWKAFCPCGDELPYKSARALVLSSLVQWDGAGAPTSAGPAALTSGISIGKGGCCTGLAGHWPLSGAAQMILYPKHFLQEKKRSFE